MSLNRLISLCFLLTSTLILLIAATLTDQQDFDSTVLIAADALSTCDCGIFPFRKSIAMTHSAWLFLVIFILDNYSCLYFTGLKKAWDQFRYTTQTSTFMLMSRSLPNRSRTPESQHAAYNLMLGRCHGCWLRWLGMTVQSILPRRDRPVCVDEGLDGLALFPSAIIILVIFFYYYLGLVRY